MGHRGAIVRTARILPVLRAERAAGALPAGAVRVLASWVCHLRGAGVPVDDVRADRVVPLAAGALPDAVRRVLDALDPAVGGDEELVKAVLADAEQGEREAGTTGAR